MVYVIHIHTLTVQHPGQFEGLAQALTKGVGNKTTDTVIRRCALTTEPWPLIKLLFEKKKRIAKQPSLQSEKGPLSLEEREKEHQTSRLTEVTFAAWQSHSLFIFQLWLQFLLYV